MDWSSSSTPLEKARFGDAAHIVPPTVARRLDSAASPVGFVFDPEQIAPANEHIKTII
jgi:hypothetical protein